ncbi:hypothetical protein J2T60_001020 [Natronospira proteinivora]|uniref:Uncharacterized protein n=1 Tax=Natronospira proteinivora TaxID=1807133 RepID=A0ABT1G6Z4_9GAMM|nr:hypothetical protein [Natronospira proteinivora]MCP1727055.1 hypothetical protein [Natronospira proteinivora]
MSLDFFRLSDRTVRRLRITFIALIVLSLAGLGIFLLLDWLGLSTLEHPAVLLLVGMLLIAAVLEFGLESLRQAGRHEDGWWRP